MIQIQIRHDVGSFPHCLSCGHEPRHIKARGSHSRETFDVRNPTGERHQIECQCGIRTPWLASLALAINHWRLHFAATRPTAPTRPMLRLHSDSRSNSEISRHG